MDRTVFSRTCKRPRAGDGGAQEATAAALEGPDLIGAIVTLLDTAEDARTAALSRRWRHVWRSAPLNLDARLRPYYADPHRVRDISQILDAHPGPARRLSPWSLRDPSTISRFPGWLQLRTFDALQELVLRFPLIANHPEIPASALRFASLRVLSIDNCTFPASGGAPGFPCLTYLSLRHVCITEELLHGMISNCSALEDLALDTNAGHHRLCLSLPRLKRLAVLVRPDRRMHEIELDDLVVQDASSLERLLLHEAVYGPSVRITGATKLKMLGYLGTGFPVIELDNSMFKGMIPVSLVNQFSTVTILALHMPPEPKLKVVIGYLRCFTCLEKLHIKLLVNVWKSLEPVLRLDPFAPIEGLDRSLKTIVLQQYAGRKTDVESARFFVERAKVLEVMKFCSIRGCATRWLQSQFRLLNIERRASRCAEFPFMCQCDLPYRFWMDEGFSSDDPFIASWIGVFLVGKFSDCILVFCAFIEMISK